MHETTAHTAATIAAELAAAGIVEAIDANDGAVLILNGPGLPEVATGDRVGQGHHYHHPHAPGHVDPDGVTVYQSNYWHEYKRADYPTGAALAVAVAARIGALMEEHGGL